MFVASSKDATGPCRLRRVVQFSGSLQSSGLLRRRSGGLAVARNYSRCARVCADVLRLALVISFYVVATQRRCLVLGRERVRVVWAHAQRSCARLAGWR